MSDSDRTRIHSTLQFLDMRAQATAMGLVQLSIELRSAGVIDEPALDRIKDSIAQEIVDNAPRSVAKQAYLADVRARLNRVFSGFEPIGPISAHVAQASSPE